MAATSEDEDRQALLTARAEEASRIGSWELDLVTGELQWSDNMFRIVGLEPGEVGPNLDFVYSKLHVDDRESVAEFVDMLSEEIPPPPLEYRWVLDSGVARYHRVTQATTERDSDGNPLRAAGSIQDIDDWRRVEREVALLVGVQRVLGEWTTLEESAEPLIAEMAWPLDGLFGTLWAPRGEVLEAESVWTSRVLRGAAGDLLEATKRSRIPRGTSTVGRAWESCHPVTLESGEELDFNRRRPAKELGLGGALAIPVFVDDVTFVIGVLRREQFVLTDSFELTLRTIGYQIGEFISRRGGGLGPLPVTPRELEILQLASQGMSGPKIAEHLFISPSTVKSHFEHIYPKLGVTDRAGAVAAALRLGLID